MNHELPPGLEVVKAPCGTWRVCHVLDPKAGGFSSVTYKADGATRQEAIANYWKYLGYRNGMPPRRKR